MGLQSFPETCGSQEILFGLPNTFSDFYFIAFYSLLSATLLSRMTELGGVSRTLHGLQPPTRTKSTDQIAENVNQTIVHEGSQQEDGCEPTPANSHISFST